MLTGSGPKSGDRPSVDEGPLDNRKLDISGEVTTTKHAGNATPMISESKSGSSGEANVLIYPILGAVSGLVVLATVVSIYCNVRKERSQNADEQNKGGERLSLLEKRDLVQYVIMLCLV